MELIIINKIVLDFKFTIIAKKKRLLQIIVEQKINEIDRTNSR